MATLYNQHERTMNNEIKRYKDYSLLAHNTFGMDVRCKCFIEYYSAQQLQLLVPSLSRPFLHIGGGSNLLFSSDYAGTILHSAIKGISRLGEDGEGHVLVKAGAGEIWDDLVAWAVDSGLGGIENLSLIPGEVGASAVQNIGAYGVEAKDVIVCVDVVDLSTGEARQLTNADCHYSYRQSIFKNELKGRYAITHVTYALSATPQLQLDYGNIRAALSGRSDVTVADVRRAIIDIRNAKLPDPSVMGNAGSFFMNPIVDSSTFEAIRGVYPDMPFYVVGDRYKIPAGWMIEKCGWKGKALGRAGVHDKQALVLVNLGGATSEEIMRLCEAVRKDVKKTFGVDIHPEVNII